MAVKKKDSDGFSISLDSIDLEQGTVRIQSMKPGIIYERFSEKTVLALEEKMTKEQKQKIKRAPRNPESDAWGSLYFVGEDENRYGLPAVNFKRSMIEASRLVEGLNMTSARLMFSVVGCEDDPSLVEIKSPSKYEIRRDWVRVSNGNPDIRYRAFLPVWSATITLQVLQHAMTMKQVINLLNLAGFCCGVGGRRPQQKCSDMFGRWAVVGI